MRNIKIIFPELGLGSNYQAQVYLMNKETDWSITTKTYNKELDLCLKENQAYYLYAKSYFGIIELFFYIDCKRDKYYFKFLNNIITFQVTDFYYKNLPIKKGEIILWLKT